MLSGNVYVSRSIAGVCAILHRKSQGSAGSHVVNHTQWGCHARKSASSYPERLKTEAKHNACCLSRLLIGPKVDLKKALAINLAVTCPRSPAAHAQFTSPFTFTERAILVLRGASLSQEAPLSHPPSDRVCVSLPFPKRPFPIPYLQLAERALMSSPIA